MADTCTRCAGRGRKVGDPGNRCVDCGGLGDAPKKRETIAPPKIPPPPVMLAGGPRLRGPAKEGGGHLPKLRPRYGPYR